MTEKTAPMPAARRFSREDWITSARKVLVETGVDDVKVDRLARKMKVTRGSFYWHFQHRKDLLDALLCDWEARNYFEIAQVRARWARTAPDLGEVVIIWLSEDPSFPAFDTAIRAWGRKSRPVSDTVGRVDEAWVSLLGEVFLKSGYDPTQSLVRARVTYFHQMGYYALSMKEETAERFRLAPYYYEVLTGHPPSDEFRATLSRLEQAELKEKAKRPRGTARSKTAAAPTEAVEAPAKPARGKPKRAAAEADA